jgi:hypothetical protein
VIRNLFFLMVCALIMPKAFADIPPPPGAKCNFRSEGAGSGVISGKGKTCCPADGRKIACEPIKRKPRPGLPNVIPLMPKEGAACNFMGEGTQSGVVSGGQCCAANGRRIACHRVGENPLGNPDALQDGASCDFHKEGATSGIVSGGGKTCCPADGRRIACSPLTDGTGAGDKVDEPAASGGN